MKDSILRTKAIDFAADIVNFYEDFLLLKKFKLFHILPRDILPKHYYNIFALVNYVGNFCNYQKL